MEWDNYTGAWHAHPAWSHVPATDNATAGSIEANPAGWCAAITPARYGERVDLPITCWTARHNDRAGSPP